MSEFVAALVTTVKIIGVAFFVGASVGVVLAIAYVLSKLVASRRDKRRQWAQAWDSTEGQVLAFADDLERLRHVENRHRLLLADGAWRPAAPGDTPGAVELDDAPAVDPDLSWLAPTGAYPLVTPTSYGNPALHAPVELRWARWTTPAIGVRVLTAAGAVR